ncbi:apolipoprotein N-acyltransferase [uncultured Cohaesibacter sp.]|uniref:apolipoprotein N-acyltransferase n=1 Tax=uncultured Cohaesibacter sp. TaxID=1002546 RepID=UPI0029C6ED96|nr:apolipoprotein N-acyltransferase [uncultured Cohaesibacter sp.]
MAFLISSLVLLDGWRRLLIAFVFGALSSLAQAPLGWFPLLWVSIPMFIWLMDSAALGKSPRQAFWSMVRVGWSFGLGFFLFTFYWIGASFLVEADTYGWMMPFAIFFFAAGLALFWALAAGLVAPVWSASPLRVLWLALSWSAMEWLRGTIFTGLPWGGIGQALTSHAVTMQALALVGSQSMALLAPILFALPVFVFSGPEHRKTGLSLTAIAVLLFAGQLVYGLQRLSQPVPTADKPVVVRIIQPNIAQKEKWKPENRSWIFSRLLALTTLDQESTPLEDVDLFVWPETAVPFYLIEQPNGLTAIAEALPDKATLMTGAIRRETNFTNEEQVYNSIYQMAGDGLIVASYDKVHLVPFGEYLPMLDWLKAIGLGHLAEQASGFTAGAKRKLLGDDKLGKILPLICYEIAFPSEIRSYPAGADMIVNVTNDAWFGSTAGPWQHMHLARMRAIETGLPVIRAANTGISAVIDPMGRIVQKLDLQTDGILQATVPGALPPTIYEKFGDQMFLFLWLLTVGFTLINQRKSRIP